MQLSLFPAISQLRNAIEIPTTGKGFLLVLSGAISKMAKDARRLLLTLLIGGGAVAGRAWMSTGTTRPLNRGHLSWSSPTILQDASEGEQETEEDFKRRMALVRSLQKSYYRSTNFTRPAVDPTTGIITDLPLWRVGWTELPGRSNMLNVHEPIYTNL
jgi:hypothetical protein